MVTLIFLICDGIEFSTGRSKFSSGKRIKTLSSSNDLSFTLFDRIFPIILLCPIFDEIPIDDIPDDYLDNWDESYCMEMAQEIHESCGNDVESYDIQLSY